MNIRRPDIKNVCFEKAELKWTAAATHYSKSQIFVQKFNFDKTLTFSRVFHPIFLTIFLVKSKLSTAKKFKTTTFSRVFHPKKIDNFLGKSKLNFWTKNEDFEQCAISRLNAIIHAKHGVKIGPTFFVLKVESENCCDTFRRMGKMHFGPDKLCWGELLETFEGKRVVKVVIA
mgnify:CR=1 FL=1